MASEIVAVVTCIGRFTVAPIVKQVKYVFNYHQNLKKLPKEVQKLMDLKQEVEGLVSSARGNAEDIKPSVEAWVEEAGQIAEAALQMIREEEELSKKRCFLGLCPNPVSRHRSSRKASKETVQILEVQVTGREFRDGSVSLPVLAVPSFPVTVTLSKDFLDFNSRSRTLGEIMRALKDPDTNVIGVYGMGGLGKTTLVKRVAAQAAEEKLFDEVVMPIVTLENVLDAKEFQEEMAKVLNMKLDDQWNQWNVSQRADRIFKRLTQKTVDEKMDKKTIVILDDLRAKLDLEQVEIPFGGDDKACKILFTSRFQYVSFAGQKDFTLGVLKEEEAWWLFQKIVGNVIIDLGFFHTGKEVTKNCKGLPILIVTVAGALKQRRSLNQWKDALENLQREGSKEMQEFVDSALKYISFNHLSAANKSLFLLCGLLGGGEISIFDQLLKLGIGWGLFKHTKTVEEARNNLETLIHDLKASFLLLDGKFIDTVRMHDVVRDVAIKIASNEGQNMLLGSSGNYWPEDGVLNRCTALTFPYGIIPPPPECLVSPSLEFLLLYHNHSSLRITDNLFYRMRRLTVLDIRSVDLSPKLPSSLAFLENLRTLSLNLCKLGDISIVGALKNLKILSLNKTGIVVLPREIGELSELRVLDLNDCSQLKVIPAGIIKRLSKLEELHMAKSFAQWEVDGLASGEIRNASLDELNYLDKLTTLRIHIPDPKLLPRDFSCKKLERFTILLGDEEWEWSCDDNPNLYRFRGIKIKVNGSINIHLEDVVKEMLRKNEILYLDGMKNIHELEWKYFQELKYVHIRHSAETRYLESFPAGLISLHLSHLPRLQNLCWGMFMSFNNLKYVSVNSCNSLRNLFSSSMARGLPHLEKLQVSDCNALEAIVEDTREYDKLEFRQLHSLTLVRLPKLASFCNQMTDSFTFPNTKKPVTTDETDSENGCTLVAPFFNEKVLFPKLEELILEGCDNIGYLFNQSIVAGLEQLNFIQIKSCKSLEGIVAEIEGEATNETIKFPQLVNLFLLQLPCLTRFCSECSIAFPILTRLRISHCSQLKTFVWADTVREDKTMTNKKLSITMQPLFNEKVELPNLKTLELERVDNVKIIWHNGLHEDSFFKLEQVDIRGCPNLLKVFPSTMLTRIQNLEQLMLWENCLVEEVFENDEMTKPNISQGGETTEDDKIIFSQLKSLDFIDLPNLKRFCSGSRVVFPSLTKLLILSCERMETFIHPIVVTSSTRRGLEDMDSNDTQPIFDEKVEFPSLKKLGLGKLGHLKIIWDSRIHEHSFSTLEEVVIRECASLLIIFPLTMFGRIQSLKKLQITESCCVEEIFEAPTNTSEWLHPNETIDVMVSDLSLCNLPKLKCVWREDLVQFLSFPNLRKVVVHRCQSLEYLFPALVSQKLNHMEELRISDCGAKTIVCQKEEGVKKETVTFVFPKLVTLWLQGLPKLESFYPGRHTTKCPSLKELVLAGMFPSNLVKFADYGRDSLLIPIAEKIESLKVRDCRGLASIVQGLVSFEFLTELEVSGCHGIVQFSTAKCLVQLTTLKVAECQRIKAIVSSESGDGAKDEIVFSNLKTLELRRLPSLVNFYHGNRVLKFQSLEEVTVTECFNMKAFCGGITITPKLKTVYLTNEKMDFEGDKEVKDLNTIIKDAVKCSEEVAEMNDKATNSSVEAECSKRNDAICETMIEPRKEVQTYDKEIEPNDDEGINSRKEAYKVDDELRKEGEFCEEIVEPREEIVTCKARNEGSQAPTPDIDDVTCPSSQSHHALGSAIGATTCQKSIDFHGLQVAQHLVPLLEKARDKHGDFHNSPLIQSKTMRIAAMESVGQVLEVLQTQTPRTMDVKKIQFMEETFNDLSNMSFPIEWLRLLLDKASKSLRGKEKIDEMEAQVQALKREIEKALVYLDQPLLDF